MESSTIVVSGSVNKPHLDPDRYQMRDMKRRIVEIEKRYVTSLKMSRKLAFLRDIIRDLTAEVVVLDACHKMSPCACKAGHVPEKEKESSSDDSDSPNDQGKW